MKLLITIFSILLAFNPGAHADQGGLWQPISHQIGSGQTGSIQQKSVSTTLSSSEAHYRVDALQLKQVLSRAGYEGRATSAGEIELPVENGAIQRFSLVESPIMAPELAARYPQIKTYKIHGIDDPAATGRLSISPKGFHAMVSSAAGTLYIDPVADNVYKSYAGQLRPNARTFSCGVTGHDHSETANRLITHSAGRTAGSLQVYRLAVAGTAWQRRISLKTNTGRYRPPV